MRYLTVIFFFFGVIKSVLSQSPNFESEKIKTLQEYLECGVYLRDDNDNPYLCDINGNILGYGLFERIISPIKDYKDGYIIVSKDGNRQQGLYDLHSKQILIPPQEDTEIFKLRQDKYIVNKKNKSYLFDPNSKTMIDTKYKSIRAYFDDYTHSYLDLFVVDDGANHGIMNKDMELLINGDYDGFELVNYAQSDRCLIQAKKGLFHHVFYDICKRKNIFSHNDGVCWYIGKINGKYCFFIDNKDCDNGMVVDENGKKLTTEKYMSIEPIGGNTFFGYQGLHKGGLLNSSLQKITPFVYDPNPYRIQYDAGLYSLINNGKYGIVNAKMNVVIPFIYDDLCFMDNGTIRAEINGKCGVIDKKGSIIIPCNYDDVREIYGSNLFAVKQNEKYGCIDKNGNIILPFIYDNMYSFCDDVYLKNNYLKSGLIITTNIDNKRNLVYDIFDVNGNKITPTSSSENDLYFHLSQYYYNQSDVDSNIPTTSIQQENTFALIIANENYSGHNSSNVDFALRDVAIFKEYCQRTLGILNDNIIYIPDGTMNKMNIGISKLKDLAGCFSNSKVIVYYSGHGIPDEQNEDSYLLPVDGMANDYRTAISLTKLYNEIGSIQAKQTVIFLDACFSGLQRDGRLLVSNTRGVAIRQKAIAPKENMVVFSASKGDEPALSYKKGKHGLFTYFLLKRLKESSGNVSLGELSQYLSQMVKKQSVLNENKMQTPTVGVSINNENNWKTLKLNNND